MCYGECCEVCKPGDSQACTPGANNTLYVNKNLKKLDFLINSLALAHIFSVLCKYHSLSLRILFLSSYCLFLICEK